MEDITYVFDSTVTDKPTKIRSSDSNPYPSLLYSLFCVFPEHEIVKDHRPLIPHGTSKFVPSPVATSPVAKTKQAVDSPTSIYHTPSLTPPPSAADTPAAASQRDPNLPRRAPTRVSRLSPG